MKLSAHWIRDFVDLPVDVPVDITDCSFSTCYALRFVGRSNCDAVSFFGRRSAGFFNTDFATFDAISVFGLMGSIPNMVCELLDLGFAGR